MTTPPHTNRIVSNIGYIAQSTYHVQGNLIHLYLPSIFKLNIIILIQFNRILTMILEYKNEYSRFRDYKSTLGYQVKKIEHKSENTAKPKGHVKNKK